MNHLQEWQASCVDEQLTQLNVTALEGYGAPEHLFYSDDLPRRNDGRVTTEILKRYEHTEHGGWWCSGIDILTGENDMWGCFKPKQPRCSYNRNKLIKYEHPPKAPTGIFALRVPMHIWEKIAASHDVAILPTDIEPEQPDFGFWQWLISHPQIPLCITEGAKKAGALLTAGYATIALPGIHGGYRVPKNEVGEKIGKSHLIPQLKKLATSGREIYLTFDQDTKPRTIQAVNGAIKRLGYLLQETGCQVKVTTWESHLGKGVDDLIATQGESVFATAYQNSLSLNIWKARLLNLLTYPATVSFNHRYLPEVEIPSNAQLIGIKSPKGTGKTKLLESVVKKALERKQGVLVIGHRVRLVEELCQRFGLNYITEVQDHTTKTTLGYGLCIDSLHPQSQAQFQAANWSDGVVIIDEVEQVLWHGLNSETCQNHRVAILKSLKSLMQNVLAGKGQVFVADADLSDIALDYLMALAGVPLEPFIISNRWQPSAEDAWQVYHYSESTPRKLVRDLEQHISEGGKPFVCLSAQKLKSKWGTCNLEAYLTKQFPQLRILRIDAESLAEPSHSAYDCIGKLDQILANYDVVLASPAIETGVSIELANHFTSVWAIAQGVQAENSVRQALGRVRANVPRFLWAAAYGFNRIGNGATSISSILSSGKRLTQMNINLLQQSDFAAFDDLDVQFQAESLLCWAKMAVRYNAGMIHYRESLIAALDLEGHQIQVAISPQQKTKSKAKDPQNTITAAIEAVREQNYRAECEAIAKAAQLDSATYQSLKKLIIKTTQQKRAIRKHELKLRYGIPVTPELVSKDDAGWYQKLRLHYFLTVGREYLTERDTLVAKKLIQQGEGSIFLPDFNRSQLGAAVGTMEVLGIPVILAHEERELTNIDSDLQAMSAIALSNRQAIKTIIGIGIAKNSSPITIMRRFLEKIGYGLQMLRSKRHGKKRLRVYQVANPHDGRWQVFSHWLAADKNRLQINTENLIEFLDGNSPDSENSPPDNFVQLCLDFD